MNNLQVLLNIIDDFSFLFLLDTIVDLLYRLSCQVIGCDLRYLLTDKIVLMTQGQETIHRNH